MEIPEYVLKKFENGKQIGYHGEFTKEGEVHWTSVAIQKISNEYYVYISSIKEKNAAQDLFDIEILAALPTLESACNFLHEKFPAPIDWMLFDIFKGQKAFNPKYGTPLRPIKD